MTSEDSSFKPGATSMDAVSTAFGTPAIMEEAAERSAIQLALHLLDFVIQGEAPEAEEARAEHEDSFIARNILSSAAVLEKRRGA